jgi:hypothetical protein
MQYETRRRATAGTLLALWMAASAYGATTAISALVDQVLAKGPATNLPPHLSLVLGLGTGVDGVAVKQAVMRSGPDVRVFNVCVSDPQKLVILHADEMRNLTAAYLFSPDSKLSKAVRYDAGGSPVEIPKAEADKAFAKEIHYWTTLGGTAAGAR